MHDGKVYAVPWDVGPCGVFYRRSIFEKYGIDPEKIETWEDYINAGKVILETNEIQAQTPVEDRRK